MLFSVCFLLISNSLSVINARSSKSSSFYSRLSLYMCCGYQSFQMYIVLVCVCVTGKTLLFFFNPKEVPELRQ